MTGEEFRHRVRETFGDELERATPENVREFIAELQHLGDRRKPGHGRYVLSPGPAESLEQSVKRFLADAAIHPDAEQARQQLWAALLEIWFAVFETHEGERFEPLFRDVTTPDDASE